MHRRTALLLVGLISLGVSGCHRASILAEGAAGGERLHQVTKVPFLMDGVVASNCRAPMQPVEPHGDFYCHVFVNEAGLETMRSGKGVYPVGTVIVKQKFTDKQGTQTELFTVLQKMEDGYDSENGDWEYSTVDHSAKNILSRGRIESCIDCHKAYEATDYVTREYLR
jgi:hypothetical protein